MDWLWSTDFSQILQPIGRVWSNSLIKPVTNRNPVPHRTFHSVGPHRYHGTVRNRAGRCRSENTTNTQSGGLLQDSQVYLIAFCDIGTKKILRHEASARPSYGTPHGEGSNLALNLGNTIESSDCHFVLIISGLQYYAKK